MTHRQRSAVFEPYSTKMAHKSLIKKVKCFQNDISLNWWAFLPKWDILIIKQKKTLKRKKWCTQQSIKTKPAEKTPEKVKLTKQIKTDSNKQLMIITMRSFSRVFELYFAENFRLLKNVDTTIYFSNVLICM